MTIESNELPVRPYVEKNVHGKTTLSIIASIFLGLLFFGVAPGASQAVDNVRSYKLPITRNGVTHVRVAYNFWSREYPDPVIDVSSRKMGKTAVNGFRSMRKLDEPVACTIQNGIYHPWSKTANSVESYYTITSVDDFRVLQPTAINGKQLRKGVLITNVIYLSEGYCNGTYSRNRDIQFYCEDVYDRPEIFKCVSSGDDDFVEQWIYLKCDEGYKAFIQDVELLKAQGVNKGSIVRYGEVGP